MRKLKNILSVHPIDNELYLVNELNFYLMKLDRELNFQLILESEVHTLQQLGGHLIINNRYLLEDNLLKPISKEYVDMYIDVSISSDLALVSYSNSFGIYSFIKDKIVLLPKAPKTNEIHISNLINQNSFLSTVNGNPDILSAYSLIDGDKIWMLNLAELFSDWDSIRRIQLKPAILNERIFFCIHDDWYTNYFLLILDGLTGQVIHQEQSLSVQFAHNGYIYNIFEDKIGRRDPDTLELELFEFPNCELTFVEESCFFYKDELFFAAYPQDSHSNIYSYWGIIDLNTFQIIHAEEMLRNPKEPSEDRNRYYIKQIIANDNIIAVQIGMDLYVYNRVEII